jgi:putative FmdB family regulatory protein
MPVYEYECGSCGKRFEIVRKFSDPAISECTFCHAVNVRKLLSTPAFVLKGSGWYVTDYASEDRKKGVEAEKPIQEPKPKADCAAGTCTTETCPAKTDS